MPSTQKRQASTGRAAQEQAPVAESHAPAAASPDKPAESPRQPATTEKPQRPTQKGGALNITDLKDISIQRLTQVAKDLKVGDASAMRKQDPIFQILNART